MARRDSFLIMAPFSSSGVIDLVEAGYDLQCPVDEWWPRLITLGAAFAAPGVGPGGAIWCGLDEHGMPIMTQLLPPDSMPDSPMRYGKAMMSVPSDVLIRSLQTFNGRFRVLSDLKEEWPDHYRALTSEFGRSIDWVEGYACDPDFHGVYFSVFFDEETKLTPSQRRTWQQLVVHLTAAARLRRRLGMLPTETPRSSFTQLPHGAECVIDPKRFKVVDRATTANVNPAGDDIRDAAIRVDRARGKIRREDPDEALDIWQALVRGRWSLVDWFDTDQRRFVLAKPNPPNLGDPRGLTEPEHQVALYAARGESGKLIAYRFGRTPQRTSTLLRSAMRKLRVRTQAQLVAKLGPMPKASQDASD